MNLAECNYISLQNSVEILPFPFFSLLNPLPYAAEEQNEQEQPSFKIWAYDACYWNNRKQKGFIIKLKLTMATLQSPDSKSRC